MKISQGLIGLVLICSILSCQKKEETTTSSTNIASTVVTNLNAISDNYIPTSLSYTRSLHSQSADPCDDVSDFAVCQSNLIRAYLQIGKGMVTTMSAYAAIIGSALGNVTSGSGVSDGITWTKTDANNWSIITTGDQGATVAYLSVANGVYTMKIDASHNVEDPQNLQLESIVNYTSDENWTVDLFVTNTDCDPTDVGDPSKVGIKLTQTSGVWTGKAMLYFPRWKAPGTTPSCSDTAGAVDITMLTDFVGNNQSTKAALYLIPSNVSSLATIGNYSLDNFCTNFAGNCGGMSEPTAGALASYTNNWCTTGMGTIPTWGDDCTSNSTIQAASYSSAADWIMPDALKIKTVTMPTSL